MSVKIQAQTFNAVELASIASNAEHQAQLLTELERKPWRRSTEQNDAIDTFRQLAAYARKIINMQKD